METITDPEQIRAVWEAGDMGEESLGGDSESGTYNRSNRPPAGPRPDADNPWALLPDDHPQRPKQCGGCGTKWVDAETARACERRHGDDITIPAPVGAAVALSRPPSQAVIEAVERAEREHHTRWFMAGHFECVCGALMTDGTDEVHRAHRRVEVARAAETAALRVAADECEANARDWYGTDIFRDVDSADLAAVRSAMQAKGKDIDNLSAWYFRRALTMRADILRRTADECTHDQEKPCP